MASHSSILIWKIPWTEELADYSPWDCKESDATEHTYLFSDWETNYLYFRLFDIISQILKASFWVQCCFFFFFPSGLVYIVQIDLFFSFTCFLCYTSPTLKLLAGIFHFQYHEWFFSSFFFFLLFFQHFCFISVLKFTTSHTCYSPFPLESLTNFSQSFQSVFLIAPTSEPYLFLFLFTTSSLDNRLLFLLLLFCMFHVGYDKTLEAEVNSIYVQKG